MKHLRLDIDIDAPAEEVFRAITDWQGQDEWMLGTRVAPVGGAAHELGGRIEAWTGAGRVGFLDTMVITVWEPPSRVVVEHTGAVVRGSGAFEVKPRGPDACTFVWSEEIVPPMGRLGQLGWPVVRPFFGDGVRRSLVAFKRLVESGRWSDGEAGHAAGTDSG